MASISLCMIVKNESMHLPRCLESVGGVADEIIVVDTGSSDDTKEKAQAFGAVVYDFLWVNDFSAARNFAFSKATKDYIMWLDADDIITHEDQAVLLSEKELLQPDIDAVYMPYNTAFDEDGNVTFHYYRTRIVKRSCNFKWQEPVHEYLEVGGKTMRFKAAITHKKMPEAQKSATRNLDIYDKIIQEGKELSLRGMYYYARELDTHKRTIESAYYFDKFLTAQGGWVEDKIASCYALSYLYEKLSEEKKAFDVLYQSFNLDLPRGEICCRIAELFAKKNDYKKGIYWYETALALKMPQTLGFIQTDAYNFWPLLGLTSLYDRIGETDKAMAYHERAKAIKPSHPSIRYNEAYFYGR